MTKSIGQTLSTARVKKGLSIEDVHKAIKIHPKFILALESDDYSSFESKVHSKGFLKIYTEFLGEDKEEMLALWRRDYGPFFSSSSKYSTKLPFKMDSLLITPTTIFVAFISIVILLFFGYLYFQYKDYVGAPVIEIYFPQDNLVLNDDIVDITGKTDLDSQVFINNEEIKTDSTGKFLTSVKLREGINTISIRSVSKLNKESQIIKNIIYRPKKVELVPETTL